MIVAEPNEIISLTLWNEKTRQKRKTETRKDFLILLFSYTNTKKRHNVIQHYYMYGHSGVIEHNNGNELYP